VRVKLDENLPRSAGPILAAAGHDVDSVEDEGLAGADDPTVSAAATADGRLVITFDRGFGDIQRYPPGSHAGILVLRIDDQSAPSVVGALTELIATSDLADLAGCVAVYRNGDLRVRRPPER
jgi:predicted nuclease of predicted toxin-antitoxin system